MAAPAVEAKLLVCPVGVAVVAVVVVAAYPMGAHRHGLGSLAGDLTSPLLICQSKKCKNCGKIDDFRSTGSLRQSTDTAS